MLVVVIAVTLKLLWTNKQLLLLPFEVVAIVIVVIATVIASTAADNGLKSMTNCGHCYVYRSFALHNTHSYIHTYTHTHYFYYCSARQCSSSTSWSMLSHLFIVVDFCYCNCKCSCCCCWCYFYCWGSPSKLLFHKFYYDLALICCIMLMQHYGSSCITLRAQLRLYVDSSVGSYSFYFCFILIIARALIRFCHALGVVNIRRF